MSNGRTRNARPPGEQPAGGPEAEGSTATTASSFALGALVVVDPRPLTRQSMAEMLVRGLPEHKVVAVSACEELQSGAAGPDPRVEMILLNVGNGRVSGVWARNALQWLKLRLPQALVIVLSDGVTPNEIDELVASGVRGYLPTSVDPELAFAAVRLVRAGGTYVPAYLFGLVTRHEAAPLSVRAPRRVGSPTATELTQKEAEVLGFLRQGQPNKVIAAQLQMQESTVKVHVRNMMRKLHAANRTQVALTAAQLLTQDADD